MRNPLFNGTKAESTAHKIIKNSLLKVFLRYAKNIRSGTLEKHIDTRRGDIYLELHDNKKVVVEVQNSRMSVKEALQRTKDYTKKNIYVLWILNDTGDCTAEPKCPRHRKHVRVSPFELFLHKIYGGRTYYIHVDYSKRGVFMSKPYALHFSLPDKKSPHIRKNKFDYFYIRNSNYVKLPTIDILCVDYGLKLARFYDKNYIRCLKTEISKVAQRCVERTCENCQLHFKRFRRCELKKKCNFQPLTKRKVKKFILKSFSKKYSKTLASKALKEVLF